MPDEASQCKSPRPRLRSRLPCLKQGPFGRPREDTMTDDLRFRPTAIRAPHGARRFSVTWADGHVTELPHELLRGYCPCAGCQGHSGAIAFQEGRDLELRDVQRVGNYALGLTWADGHSSGIYTFAFLRNLGDLVEAEGTEAVRERGTLPRFG